MDLKKLSLDELKGFILMNYRLDDTDRPIDSLHNIQHLLLERLNLTLDSKEFKDEFVAWKNKEDEFIKSLLFCATWQIEGTQEK